MIFFLTRIEKSKRKLTLRQLWIIFTSRVQSTRFTRDRQNYTRYIERLSYQLRFVATEIKFRKLRCSEWKKRSSQNVWIPLALRGSVCAHFVRRPITLRRDENNESFDGSAPADRKQRIRSHNPKYTRISSCQVSRNLFTSMRTRLPCSVPPLLAAESWRVRYLSLPPYLMSVSRVLTGIPPCHRAHTSERRGLPGYLNYAWPGRGKPPTFTAPFNSRTLGTAHTRAVAYCTLFSRARIPCHVYVYSTRFLLDLYPVALRRRLLEETRSGHVSVQGVHTETYG